MVQIIENWAELTGTVRSINDSDKGPEHRTVLIEADAVTDVEGFPNLITATAGDEVQVIARRDILERCGVTEGSHVRCQVRKATPFEIFAHPDGFTVTVDETATTTCEHEDPAASDPTFDL